MKQKADSLKRLQNIIRARDVAQWFSVSLASMEALGSLLSISIKKLANPYQT
jgi:hypothetical protein